MTERNRKIKRILASIGVGLLAGLELCFFGKCDHARKLAGMPSHLLASPSQSSPSSAKPAPAVKRGRLFFVNLN